MTELELQEAIKDILLNEVFSQLTIFTHGEMKVFLQDIPLSSDFEEYEEDEKYFPCCIVRLSTGEIQTANDPQLTTVEIIIYIKDWSKDMTGYRNLVITIDRIRDYFTANVGILGKFRMVFPLNWGLSDEVGMPFFAGKVITKWQTDRMPFADIQNFL